MSGKFSNSLMLPFLILFGFCNPTFGQLPTPFSEGVEVLPNSNSQISTLDGISSIPATSPKHIDDTDVLPDSETSLVLIPLENIFTADPTKPSPQPNTGGAQAPELGSSFSTSYQTDEVKALQNTFLQFYKKYAQSVLKSGKGSTESKAAYKDFQKAYSDYKVEVVKMPIFDEIKNGRAKVQKVIISKADFTISVYCDNQLIRVFPCAYGANPDGGNKKAQGDARTPEGTFRIASKAVNPSYKGIPGGAPNNPVGTRWMGLNTWGGSIAMHGTNNPSSIGTRASHGCIRMYTKDAEELYPLVKMSDPVIIMPVK
ncbi:MAG: L,D-transpeptidase [Candidatus Riflebacteria bacterium]|nr:L,D-transpeptidase [Candidatus Riflebacteria bacterium]